MMPTDKFQLAAVVDRLIYDNEETFDACDADVVLDSVPSRSWRQFLPDVSLRGSIPGRSAKGVAAGFGNVNMRDNAARKFELDARGAARVGQWKLYRGWRSIVIEQVASDALDDQRSAKIRFSWRWMAMRMDILILKSVMLAGTGVSFGIWRPWKRPA